MPRHKTVETCYHAQLGKVQAKFMQSKGWLSEILGMIVPLDQQNGLALLQFSHLQGLRVCE